MEFLGHGKTCLPSASNHIPGNAEVKNTVLRGLWTIISTACPLNVWDFSFGSQQLSGPSNNLVWAGNTDSFSMLAWPHQHGLCSLTSQIRLDYFANTIWRQPATLTGMEAISFQLIWHWVYPCIATVNISRYSNHWSNFLDFLNKMNSTVNAKRSLLLLLWRPTKPVIFFLSA